MPLDALPWLPLVIPALEGVLAAALALTLAQVGAWKAYRIALPLCVVFGIVFALIPFAGWGLAGHMVLCLALGGLVLLLFKSSPWNAAAAAVLAALLEGMLELLRATAGPLVLIPAAAVLALLYWKKIALLPDTPDVLIAADHQQSRRFYSSTATILGVLLLTTAWVWFTCTGLDELSGARRAATALFAAAIVAAILFVLRKMAFAAVRSMEAVIDKRYQAELLNLMQVIRSQRHDFNFHIQAISGMIEQGKYAECEDYVRSMVKTATVMNDLLPLHDPAVSAMINSFREVAAQKQIQLDVDISDDLGQIPCSVYEINTVIGNLIQNAVDEVERSGGNSLWISVLILKRGGKHIVKVTNPCGRDPETFRDCFKPGYTTKQSHEGIGLATVMRIVSKYHGAVFPEFEDGAVSFIVQMPSRFS